MYQKGASKMLMKLTPGLLTCMVMAGLHLKRDGNLPMIRILNHASKMSWEITVILISILP